MLKIRLRRGGATHAPFYRIVVSDSRRTARAEGADDQLLPVARQSFEPARPHRRLRDAPLSVERGPAGDRASANRNSLDRGSASGRDGDEAVFVVVREDAEATLGDVRRTAGKRG